MFCIWFPTYHRPATYAIYVILIRTGAIFTFTDIGSCAFGVWCAYSFYLALVFIPREIAVVSNLTVDLVGELRPVFLKAVTDNFCPNERLPCPNIHTLT